MAVTIKDIARLGGVSIATVSKVVNNKCDDIGTNTIVRIKKIVEETNYIPNSIARSMILKTTKTIGVIIPDVRNPFFTDLVRGVEDTANQHGFTVFIGNTDDDIDKEIKYIQTLEEKRVDGIVLAGAAVRDMNREENINVTIPVITIDRNVHFKGIRGSVEVDNFNGAYDAVDYLIKKGHKDIIFLSGPWDTKPTIDRYEGYKKALLDNNVERNEDNIHVGTYTKEFGEKIANQISGTVKGKAIFCGNDLIAFGAVNAFKKNGIDIPGDISVMGYDDIDICTFISPELSTVRQPSYDIGCEGVAMLLDIIENKEVENYKLIKTELVIRESS
ncbi:MAG: LacI family DNA-binding transcriptional regulator [Clostridium sp.]|uniref:LacI family DNA-binding transcriptional regulator n=1 Tax=Clostridium sp. TaxID=1506 RepID=UPI0030531975